MQQPAQQRQPEDQPDAGVAAVATLVSRVDGCRIGLGGVAGDPCRSRSRLWAYIDSIENGALMAAKGLRPHGRTQQQP